MRFPLLEFQIGGIVLMHHDGFVKNNSRAVDDSNDYGDHVPRFDRADEIFTAGYYSVL